MKLIGYAHVSDIISWKGGRVNRLTLFNKKADDLMKVSIRVDDFVVSHSSGVNAVLIQRPQEGYTI